MDFNILRAEEEAIARGYNGMPAREWIHRHIKDETQLQKALAKMDEYAKRMNENQRPAEEVQE